MDGLHDSCFLTKHWLQNLRNDFIRLFYHQCPRDREAPMKEQQLTQVKARRLWWNSATDINQSYSFLSEDWIGPAWYIQHPWFKHFRKWRNLYCLYKIGSSHQFNAKPSWWGSVDLARPPCSTGTYKYHVEGSSIQMIFTLQVEAGQDHPNCADARIQCGVCEAQGRWYPNLGRRRGVQDQASL